MKRLFTAVVLAFAVLGSACSTSRYYDYRFTPAPMEVEVAAPAIAGAQVRTLVSVLGVARANKAGRDQVELRVRIENLGTVPATFATSSLSLVSADLQSFGTPDVAPPGDKQIAPGGHEVFDVAFPMPAGAEPTQVDMSGLNLRWAIGFEGVSVTAGATFTRIEIEYYDGYPRWSFGVGYSHVN